MGDKHGDRLGGKVRLETGMEMEEVLLLVTVRICLLCFGPKISMQQQVLNGRLLNE